MIESRMNIDKIKFGKFIAGRRRALSSSLTQKSLAEILHVGTSAIGKIEAGETLPSFELFIELAAALQMTPGELMMVMAEQVDESARYAEMNEWLYRRLIKVVQEYESLKNPAAGMDAAKIDRRMTDMGKGLGIARVTPEVAKSGRIKPATPIPAPDPDSESDKKGDDAGINSTTNSQ